MPGNNRGKTVILATETRLQPRKDRLVVNRRPLQKIGKNHTTRQAQHGNNLFGTDRGRKGKSMRIKIELCEWQ